MQKKGTFTLKFNHVHNDAKRNKTTTTTTLDWCFILNFSRMQSDLFECTIKGNNEAKKKHLYRDTFSVQQHMEIDVILRTIKVLGNKF